MHKKSPLERASFVDVGSLGGGRCRTSLCAAAQGLPWP
jgi:hypothetical protein